MNGTSSYTSWTMTLPAPFSNIISLFSNNMKESLYLAITFIYRGYTIVTIWIHQHFIMLSTSY